MKMKVIASHKERPTKQSKVLSCRSVRSTLIATRRSSRVSLRDSSSLPNPDQDITQRRVIWPKYGETWICRTRYHRLGRHGCRIRFTNDSQQAEHGETSRYGQGDPQSCIHCSWWLQCARHWKWSRAHSGERVQARLGLSKMAKKILSSRQRCEWQGEQQRTSLKLLSTRAHSICDGVCLATAVSRERCGKHPAPLLCIQLLMHYLSAMFEPRHSARRFTWYREGM